MLNDNMKEKISKKFFEMLADFIEEGEPFGLIIQNNNDWNKELPDRLKSQNQFMIKIENDTLNDSFVIREDGEIEITIGTEFDGEFFSKEFTHEDVAGFFLISNMRPFLIKPFVLKKLSILKEGKRYGFDPNDIKEEDLIDSMNAFKKFNPELFKNE